MKTRLESGILGFAIPLLLGMAYNQYGIEGVNSMAAWLGVGVFTILCVLAIVESG